MEDPLKTGRQNGIIQNARVRRRTGTKPVTAAATPTISKGTRVPHHTSKIDTESSMTSEGKDNQRRTSSIDESKLEEPEKRQSIQEKKAATKTLGLKREQSDIFKSFAKPRAKVSRENSEGLIGPSPVAREGSPASVMAPKVEEDAHMSDGSESDHAEELLKTKKTSTKPGAPSRSEREEQLRKMMEDDEDAMEITQKKSESQADDQAILEPSKEQSEEPPTNLTARAGGRRRGRRKVMKKKMLKDEEGYLGMHCSDQRGAGMGIIFRGRAFADDINAVVHRLVNCKEQKGGWKARTRQYNVFLWQEMRVAVRAVERLEGLRNIKGVIQ
ncbi:MAG: hypothetical protein LQ346_001684 [Caloplaca aetnensis]|nr:MAG: hypothetical protein LQ346_001684 [Caloplaca aetnensis]